MKPRTGCHVTRLNNNPFAPNILVNPRVPKHFGVHKPSSPGIRKGIVGTLEGLLKKSLIEDTQLYGFEKDRLGNLKGADLFNLIKDTQIQPAAESLGLEDINVKG